MSKSMLLGCGSFASAAFVPSGLAGLGLWLKADDPALSLLADGAAVIAWTGQEAAAHIFGGTGTYKTNIVNGKPVVRFNGIIDYFRNATGFLTGQSGSIFFVHKTSPVNANAVFFGETDVTGADYFLIQLPRTVGNNDVRALKTSIVGAETITNPFWGVTEVHSTGSAYEFTKNGVVQSVTIEGGSNDGGWAGDVVSPTNVTIGAYIPVAASNFYTGDLAELIVYDGVTLTSPDKAKVRGYLGAKYGIAV